MEDLLEASTSYVAAAMETGIRRVIDAVGTSSRSLNT
jgi:hypothetical protein